MRFSKEETAKKKSQQTYNKTYLQFRKEREEKRETNKYLANTIDKNALKAVSIGGYLIMRGDIMPRFDGTGPMGRGPLTGRGMGFCAVPLSEITPRGYIPTPYRPTSVYGYGVPYPSMPRFFFLVHRPVPV